jgi:hypothetical protein
MNIHKNDDEGLQVEWQGVLLTLRPNGHHGLSGSIAVKDNGKLQVLSFHGQSQETLFPMEFHEEGVLDESGAPEKGNCGNQKHYQPCDCGD